MLTCVDLKASYGDNIIFQNLSFTSFDSSILFLKGKNGAGKTSLLKVLAGLKSLDEGSIYWDGTNIKDHMEEYLSSMVSYLGHNNALKLEFTVLENLEFWASLKDTYELIMPALKFFELLEFADIKCLHLSAGWKKRVALSRLIISNTPIWLLDEPDNNLDATAKYLLQGLINTKVKEQQGIVIVSSHNFFDPNYSNKLDLENFNLKLAR